MNNNFTYQSHKLCQKGFSFIELLIVVSIVGIFTNSALPIFNELIVRKELTTAQTTLLQTLHRAKNIAETQATIVDVAIANNLITITPGNTAQNQIFKLPKTINFSSSTTFKFDSMGMVIGIAVDKDITLKTSTDYKLQSVVTVTPTGLITTSS